MTITSIKPGETSDTQTTSNTGIDLELVDFNIELSLEDQKFMLDEDYELAYFAFDGEVTSKEKILELLKEQKYDIIVKLYDKQKITKIQIESESITANPFLQNPDVKIAKILHIPGVTGYLDLIDNYQQKLDIFKEFIQDLKISKAKFTQPREYIERIESNNDLLQACKYVFCAIFFSEKYSNHDLSALQFLWSIPKVKALLNLNHYLLNQVQVHNKKGSTKLYIDNFYECDNLSVFKQSFAKKISRFTIAIMDNDNIIQNILEKYGKEFIGYIHTFSYSAMEKSLSVARIKDLYMRQDNINTVICAMFNNSNNSMIELIEANFSKVDIIRSFMNFHTALKRKVVAKSKIHNFEKFCLSISSKLKQDSSIASELNNFGGIIIKIIDVLIFLNPKLSLSAETQARIVRDLIALPGVTDIVPQDNNKLLNDAVSTNNMPIAEVLLEIPAVMEIFQNNYVFSDDNNPTMLELARKKESSMVDLTKSEMQTIEMLSEHYGLKSGGKSKVDDAINDLKNYCVEKYHENPASLLMQGGTMGILPFDWYDLQKFLVDNKVESNRHKIALEKYYQNNFHTAYRYLSVPNKWLSKNAGFTISRNSIEHANFESNIDKIALFWLAASDQNEPNLDGYTFQIRQEHFIRELAYIGRAHNWDKTRPVNSNSKQTEEYDDLDGDNPSCARGVLRRLLQSVPCHSRIQYVTKEHIEFELRDYVRNQYRNIIRQLDRKVLDNLYRTLFDEDRSFFYGGDLTLDVLPIDLNIDRTKARSHLASRFKTLSSIALGFAIDKYFPATTSICSDFVNLYSRCALDTLVKDCYEELNASLDQEEWEDSFDDHHELQNFNSSATTTTTTTTSTAKTTTTTTSSSSIDYFNYNFLNSYNNHNKRSIEESEDEAVIKRNKPNP